MGRSLPSSTRSAGGLVDLDAEPHDSEAAALADELLDGDGEDQVAWARLETLRPRLVRRHAPALHHGTLLVRPEGRI